MRPLLGGLPAEFVRDLKQGVRTLHRDFAFSGVAVFVLALGIGVSSAMFSLVNTVLIRPLPYAEPGRLVSVSNSWTGVSRGSVSTPEYLDYLGSDQRGGGLGFETMALHHGRRVGLTLGGTESEGAIAEVVTERFFEVFGVDAALGRAFSHEDELASTGALPAVVSDSFWRQRLGAAADAIGRTLGVDGSNYTIVGVKGSQRSQDAALRAALGASRRRLIQQFLIETAVLSAAGKRTSRALLVTQVALTATLLSATGLLARSFLNLQFADMGFDVDHVLSARIVPDPNRYPEDSHTANFYRQVLDRLRNDPSVKAAVVSVPPLSYGLNDQEVFVEGYDQETPGNRFEQYRVVSPGYFATVRIPVLSGREFENTDSGLAAGATIVSRSLARKYWGEEDPVGRRLRLSDSSWKTAVGVVGDIFEKGVGQPSYPVLYLPLAQYPWREMTLLARSSDDPRQLVGKVRGAIHEVDPRQKIYSMLGLAESMNNWTGEPRFNTFLVGFFALLALLLAVAGLYGLLSFLASGRHHEIGIRTALGAQQSDILIMIVGTGMRWTLAGLGLGSLAGLILGHYLESRLVRVPPADLVTMAGVWAVLLLSASVACYLPARRAANGDPWRALRDQ